MERILVVFSLAMSLVALGELRANARELSGRSTLVDKPFLAMLAEEGYTLRLDPRVKGPDQDSTFGESFRTLSVGKSRVPGIFGARPYIPEHPVLHSVDASSLNAYQSCLEAQTRQVDQALKDPMTKKLFRFLLTNNAKDWRYFTLNNKNEFTVELIDYRKKPAKSRVATSTLTWGNSERKLTMLGLRAVLDSRGCHTASADLISNSVRAHFQEEFTHLPVVDVVMKASNLLPGGWIIEDEHIRGSSVSLGELKIPRWGESLPATPASAPAPAAAR